MIDSKRKGFFSITFKTFGLMYSTLYAYRWVAFGFYRPETDGEVDELRMRAQLTDAATAGGGAIIAWWWWWRYQCSANDRWRSRFDYVTMTSPLGVWSGSRLPRKRTIGTRQRPDVLRVRLRSHRHECGYEYESGFTFTRTSFTHTSGAFAVTCTSIQLNACLLTISSEIESS